MRAKHFLLFLFVAFLTTAHAQYVAAGVGGVINNGTLPSSTISNPPILTAEAGLPVLPILDASLHYSFARPSLRTGSASSDVPTHTITVDARLHTPEISGWRGFVLGGVGLTHYSADLSTPAAALSGTQPVLDFGGGVERKIVGLVRVRGEIRDYFTSKLYGGTSHWNRVVVTAGVVFGK